MPSARFSRMLVLALLLLAIPVASFAGVFVSITVAPPPLPVYVQPVCPQPGYMWTPGYWGWEDEGYYWVPGTWVPSPSVGVLWTPGYWGFDDGSYRWNGGYWGPHVGFYGGVNYGFGYGGEGFGGGEWRGDGFYYNRAVVNVNNTHITNVYVNNTVNVNNTTVNRVSYNGGSGGTRNSPSQIERQAAQERHMQPTQVQARHESAASHDRQLLAKHNGGKPAIAATSRPADFSRRSAVPARAAGGRVEPATLKASARTMPATRTQAVASRAPSVVSRQSASAAPRDNRNVNVPRPPSAATRDNRNASSMNAATRDNRNAPSMNAAPRDNRNASSMNAVPRDNRNASRPPTASGRPALPPPSRVTRQAEPQRPQAYGGSARPQEARPIASPNYSRSQPQMRSNPPRAESRPQSAPPFRAESRPPSPPPHVQNPAPRPSAPARNSAPPPPQDKQKQYERERR